VLKREYNGLFAVGLTLAIFNIAAHYFYDGSFTMDLFWKVVLIVTLVIFLTLRTLKKTTKVLEVEGR
jgi:hypothetical protein